MAAEIFSFSKALRDGVACQKRTNRNKQFVFVFPENPEFVYKGPFSREKVERIKKRAAFVASKHVLPPIREIIDDGKIYLVYENLAKDYSISWFDHSESFSDLSYRVLERNTLVKLGDALEKCGEILKELIPSLLPPLIALYYLQTGDMNLSNILYDQKKQTATIIDYDEVRSSENEGEFFFFNKDPGEKKKEKWLIYARPSYSLVEEKLKVYDFPSEFVSKVLTQLPFSIEQKPVGSMKKGMFSGQTFSGYKVDEIKSGLQKYIRRGMTEKAVQCATELYRMIEVDGKANQTNLYNRLAVIAAEDIGPADMDLALSVINLVNTEDRNYKRMIRAVELLCEAKKTRIMSHLYFAYTTPEGRLLLEKTGVQGEDSERKKAYEKLPDYPEDLLLILHMMIRRLDQRSRLATYWAGKFMEYEGKVKKRGRMGPHFFTIESVLSLFMNPEEYKVILHAFMKQREKRPFLMFAIVSILNDEIGIPFDIDETKKDVSGLLKGEYNLVLDDYVYDMHTRAGRNLSKGRNEFRSVGSFVENRSEKYTDEVLESIYKEGGKL